MTSFEINFANILDVSPRPISCMRLNEKTKAIALYRGGDFGSIELWDVSHQPCLIKQLIHMELINGKPSVESIVWAQGRLFSGGLHGFVVEHDLKTGKIKNKTAATSGPVWCLAVKPGESQLAAGTEDGFINIFDVVGGNLVYLKVLDRQEGRVLCMDWSPCGNYIASGSVDSVRLWDVEKGHAIQRLITGRSKKKETIVWSIIMMDNMTLVSGDSRGMVSFWDGRVGVLKSKIVTHKADILTLKLSQDKTQLYAAGVDPIVIIMNRIANTDKWVKSHPRVMHTNDVTTLETLGNKLFSGGMDADFIMSSFPPKVVTKMPPLPSQGSFCLSNDRVLIFKETSINIWKLPMPDTELVQLLNFKTKGDEPIYSASLSKNGRLFTFSTLKYIRVFLLNEEIKVDGATDIRSPSKTIAQLSRLRLIDEQGVIPNNFWHLSFINNKQILGISSDGRKALFLKINSDDSTVNVSDCVAGPLQDEMVLMNESGEDLVMDTFQMSADGSHFCINSNNHVSIYSLDETDLSFDFLCAVPTYHARVTSANFHPEKPLLLLTFADHSIQVYDFSRGKIIFSEKIKKKFDDLQPLLGSTWIRTNGDGEYTTAVLFQVDAIFLLKMEPTEEPVKKSEKVTTPKGKGSERFEFSVKTCAKKYKYLSYVQTFSCKTTTSENIVSGECIENKLVAVEVSPNSILEKLPPSFAKKRFGS